MSRNAIREVAVHFGMLSEDEFGRNLWDIDDGELVAVLDRFHQELLQRTHAECAPRPRRLGTMSGTVLAMADDFDAPLEDFQEHMP